MEIIICAIAAITLLGCLGAILVLLAMPTETNSPSPNATSTNSKTKVASPLEELKSTRREISANEAIEDVFFVIIKEQSQPITGVELATQVGCSINKTHAICRKMIYEGKIQRHIIRIPGKGEMSAYSLA